MKKTAFLVNTSRGAGGLNVLTIEPLPAGLIFRILPNLVCAPHLG